VQEFDDFTPDIQKSIEKFGFEKQR
jgi:hypothetical protein